jgi:protein PhnA
MTFQGYLWPLSNQGQLVSSVPPCPKCQYEYTYEDGDAFVCPECDHRWSATTAEEVVEEGFVVRDANGNVLQDGDSVVLLKELKVKGAPTPLKAGTKVRSIRLVDGDHNIDCKIDGFGAMALKSEFVRKA